MRCRRLDEVVLGDCAALSTAFRTKTGSKEALELWLKENHYRDFPRPQLGTNRDELEALFQTRALIISKPLAEGM